MVFFELFTGSSFFLSDNHDNIFDDDSFKILKNFSSTFKARRLHKVKNIEARNLLSQMLQRDPSMRITLDRIIPHPFVSGRQASRMIGEEPVILMNILRCILYYILYSILIL